MKSPLGCSFDFARQFKRRRTATVITDIDESINVFRLASRDLYNNCFRNSFEDFALIDEGFKEVQSVLFRKLVIQPFGLPDVEYADVNKDIKVSVLLGWSAPALINRECKSGYWDYSIKEITEETEMCFVCFFDFGGRYVDHQYVQVYISSWPAHPETSGKHALIEHQYVKFSCPI